MNPTHVHLLITHLPIFGSVLGALVLAFGLGYKSAPTKIAAYAVLIISSIGAGIAYLTGEPAEESVEHLQGVSENMIHDHEEFALFALIGLIITGVLALIGLYLTIKRSPRTRTIAQITLLVSLVSFGLVAWTGYLGGQIRHTEINPSATSAENLPEEKGKSN